MTLKAFDGRISTSTFDDPMDERLPAKILSLGKCLRTRNSEEWDPMSWCKADQPINCSQLLCARLLGSGKVETVRRLGSARAYGVISHPVCGMGCALVENEGSALTVLPESVKHNCRLQLYARDHNIGQDR